METSPPLAAPPINPPPPQLTAANPQETPQAYRKYGFKCLSLPEDAAEGLAFLPARPQERSLPCEVKDASRPAYTRGYMCGYM